MNITIDLKSRGRIVEGCRLKSSFWVSGACDSNQDYVFADKYKLFIALQTIADKYKLFIALQTTQKLNFRDGT